MSSAVSSVSAQASSSSIDPRRLQQPASNHTSSEDHDSYNDSIDQSFLSSYQSMKNSSSSSPSAMGTSGDYSSGYDDHNDFPMLGDDFLDQALAPYQGTFPADDSVLPSIETPNSNHENPSSPSQPTIQQHTDDNTSPLISSRMAPTVPPRSSMRPRTPQISVSTDMGHPQIQNDIETHSFHLGRKDSTPINAAASPSVVVGMWDSTTIKEIHTPMNALVDPLDNGYFPPQHPSSTAVPSNMLDSHTSATWGEDGSGRGGTGPDRRPQEETLNFRDQEKAAENEARLSIVQSWMERDDDVQISVDSAPWVDQELPAIRQGRRGSNVANSPRSPFTSTTPDGVEDPETQPIEPPDDIDISNLRPLSPELAPTVNQVKEGQVYINRDASTVDARDIELLELSTGTLRLQNDAPVSRTIVNPDHGGSTAAFAMEQYRRAADNFSMLSRRATWGTTRRLSDTDIEGERSANLLTRPSFGKGADKKPSFFNRAVALARKSSVGSKLKRTRSDAGANQGSPLASGERSGSTSLAPPTTPSRRPSRSPAVPRLETNIGDLLMPTNHPYHSRRASTSNASPTSSIGDFVRQIRSRSRSKSDLNRSSGIAEQWKREGGPPVVTPSAGDDDRPESFSGQGFSDAEGEDDDDEEFRRDEKLAPNTRLQIVPTTDGFRQNVLALSPHIKQYLIDRFAHQQQVRYKNLLQKRLNHENACQNGSCPSGPKFCFRMGGQAHPLPPKTKGRNSRVAQTIDDGSDSNPDNKLGPENFPAGIPMPPTDRFPAELECPYCYVVKKFQKPSDWTKHIQEDIAPFTCTWAGCKDARSFKRKADYVRHENEKHRHIESWNCDIDDCTHECHRKDNFQAHLVREHRMLEPKARNKADIQKATGYDAHFWGIVDRCHRKSSAEATHEPCKFCGKSFSTFKKLSGHEAKHMEQISLPIIHLVESLHINTDTIISPVGPPPISQQPETPIGITSGASPFSQSNSGSHMSPGSEYVPYADSSPTNINALGLDYSNQQQFQPTSYGFNMNMPALQHNFNMGNGTTPIPIQGHKYSSSSPMQHGPSRSHGESSPLAHQMDQFTMNNQFRNYGQDASRSLSRSYGSSMADPSSPLSYPVTNGSFAGFVGTTTSMPMTSAGHPATFGMPTSGLQAQFGMASNNNHLYADLDPASASMNTNYNGMGQNSFGQTQMSDGMAMYRSHSDSGMPGMQRTQQQYPVQMPQQQQYTQVTGGFPLQQQMQQGLVPEQGNRPRSTSGGNSRLSGRGMPQQYMRHN